MPEKKRSPAHRKAIKLVRDPKLFFEDAVRKRFGGSKRAPGAERTFQRPYAMYDDDASPSDAPFSASTLLESLAERYPILFTIDEVELKIGVVEDHLVGLLHAITRYAQSHDMYVEVMVARSRFSIQFGVSGELMQAIRRSPWHRLTISNAHDLILAFDIYPYREQGGVLVCTGTGVAMRSLPADLSQRLLSGEAGMWWPEQILGDTQPAEHTQEVDFVYTWVDGSQEQWQKLYKDHFGHAPDPDRYKDREEMRYSLRSLYYYCRWARKIFIVSNCEAPAWLDTEHPQIVWVDHRDILKPENLPTFNCHAIETGLLDIEGLSNLFVYMNDDVFITSAARKAMFFDHLDRSRAFLEPVGKLVHGRGGNGHREETWFIARLNAQRDLLERYGYAATRMHHHSPFAINRERCLEMFSQFPDVVTQVAASKNRSESDYPLVSFMYPHYSVARGFGSVYQVDSQMLNLSNYQNFVCRPRAQFLCVNDGAGSAEDKHFGESVTSFMRRRFPFRAPWEK